MFSKLKISHQSWFGRSRELKFLFQTCNRFFKPEVETQTHTDSIILQSDGLAYYKNMFCF